MLLQKTAPVVQVYDDAVCSSAQGSSQTVTAGATTHNDITYATDGSDDGAIAFYVVMTDAGGNASACTNISLGYTLDTTDPDPLTGGFTWALSSPANGTTSSDNTPVVSLTGAAAENGSSVQVYDDAVCSSAQGSSQTVTAGATTHNDITYATDGSDDGAIAFYVVMTDAGGNASACTNISLGYTLDTTDPDPLTGGFTWALSSPANGTTSSDNTPVVSLTGAAAENGSSVQVYDDAVCSSAQGSSQTVTAGATTHNDITYATDGSDDGAIAFYVVMTDAGG